MEPVDSPAAFWQQAEALITHLAEQVSQTSGFAAMVMHGQQAKAQNLLTLDHDQFGRRLTNALTAIYASGTKIGALRTDLPPDFMLTLAFAVARPSDEWLLAARDKRQARIRAKKVAGNYRLLFQA